MPCPPFLPTGPGQTLIKLPRELLILHESEAWPALFLVRASYGLRCHEGPFGNVGGNVHTHLPPTILFTETQCKPASRHYLRVA
jgi:hypothetical protein